MFILNIVDSKEMKTELRRLFVGHHAEYDFSESEEDYYESMFWLIVVLIYASVLLSGRFSLHKF